jgi:acyl-ACP thioesterase
VNHCRYVDWIIDCLSKQELKERGIRSIQLNFVQQVPLGANINIIRFKDTNHHAVFFGMNADMEKSPTTNRCHFQVRVGFRE